MKTAQVDSDSEHFLIKRFFAMLSSIRRYLSVIAEWDDAFQTNLWPRVSCNRHVHRLHHKLSYSLHMSKNHSTFLSCARWVICCRRHQIQRIWKAIKHSEMLPPQRHLFFFSVLFLSQLEFDNLRSEWRRHFPYVIITIEKFVFETYSHFCGNQILCAREVQLREGSTIVPQET
jgi:hypothetical protein